MPIYQPVSGGSGSSAPSIYDMVVAADGSGDYTDFAEAITAATANQSILIKPGEYTLTSALSTSISGLKIVGLHINRCIINIDSFMLTFSGSSLTLENLKFKSVNSYLNASNVPDLQVRNCIFESTPTLATPVQRFARLGSSIDTARAIIENTKFILTNTTNIGFIGVGFSTKAKISNCYFEGTPRGSGYLAAGGSNYSNCHFHNPTFNNIDPDAQMLSPADAQVTGSQFTTNNFSSMAAIGNTSSGFIAMNNWFDSYNSAVKSLGDRQQFIGNRIKTVNNSAAYGIKIAGDYSIISNNRFGDVASTANAIAIILDGATTASYNIISTNSIYRYDRSIKIEANAANNTIIGNSGYLNDNPLEDLGTDTVIIGNQGV